MLIHKNKPKETSLLYGNEMYTDELVRLMMDRFRGRDYKIPRQTIANTYFPMPSSDWYKALHLHLCHDQTVGLYPINERGFVSTLTIDVDDHDGSYEQDEFIRARLLPIIAHCEQFGIGADYILIEHSGAGYHLFFRTAIPVPAMHAVDFLMSIKGNPKNEIRPDNPRPPGPGRLIRLPLGIHQQRAHVGAAGAVSHLCAYDNGTVTVVNDIRQTIDLLERWRPLENDQMLAVIGTDPRQMFLTARVDGVSERLENIRQYEQRACIRKILSHPTVDGYRGNMCYHVGIYLKNNLRLRSDEVRVLLHEWAAKFTVPPLTYRKVEDNLKGAMKSAYGVGCRTPMNCNICMEYALGGTCEYSRAQGRLPVKSSKVYGSLKNGRSALSKVQYSLMEIAHLKGEHPDRGGGWVKATHEEIAARAKIAASTMYNKKPKGRFKGMKILEVLAEQGKIEFETVAGSKFLWFRVISE